MFPKLMLAAIVGVFAALYLRNDSFITLYNSLVGTKNKSANGERLLTLDELKLYDGVSKPELYLAVLGKVYDVSKGSNHYGPGKAYNFFVGRDSSCSFVTGKFNEEGANEEVVRLKADELLSLEHWVGFYQKEYTKVGKLIGRYYLEDGNLTPYGKQVRKLIKSAKLSKANEDLEQIKFPPCNVEWDAVKGSRVWCTNKSGGIPRDWIGVPRQLFELGSKNHRCACISDEYINDANIKEYSGCEKESTSCFVQIQS